MSLPPDIDDRFLSVQERLDETKIRLETWLELRRNVIHVEEAEPIQLDLIDIEEFGYGSYDGQWVLLVRSRTVAWGSNFAEDVKSVTIPLIGASHALKLAAAGKLAELISRLIAHTESALPTLRFAHRLAESLDNKILEGPNS